MEPTSYIPSVYTEYDDFQTKRTPQFDDKEILVELNDLYSYEFSLIKPIPAKIKYDAENRIYIMTQGRLNLWGESTTLYGAEKELAREIVSLYSRLSSLEQENANQLGPYPKELLSYLKEFISR